MVGINWRVEIWESDSEYAGSKLGIFIFRGSELWGCSCTPIPLLDVPDISI